MQPLRRRQASKAWEKRVHETVKRPPGQFVWTKDTTMLLLVNRDKQEDVEATQAFAKTYRKKVMEVSILNYTKTKYKKNEELPADTWTPAQMTFSGLPKPEAEEPWRKKTYDLVVHCGMEPLAPFDFLAAGLTAHRRVASYDTALPAYDLVVTPPSNTGVKAFLEQVVHYISILTPG